MIVYEIRVLVIAEANPAERARLEASGVREITDGEAAAWTAAQALVDRLRGLPGPVALVMGGSVGGAEALPAELWAPPISARRADPGPVA